MSPEAMSAELLDYLVERAHDTIARVEGADRKSDIAEVSLDATVTVSFLPAGWHIAYLAAQFWDVVAPQLLCALYADGQAGERDFVPLWYLDEETLHRRAPNTGTACLALRSRNYLRSVLERFLVTEENVLDYVQFMFPLLAGEDAVLLGPGESPTWYTPLLDAESDRLSDALAAQPLELRHTDEELFRVSGCVLQGDRLYPVELEVRRRGRPAGLGAEACQSGDIRWSVKSGLVAGLPDNWRLPRHRQAALAPGYGIDDPDGWRKLDAGEAYCIIQDVNRQVWPLIDSRNVSMRKKALSFYPGMDLYEVTVEHDAPRKVYLVWRPGLAVVLNGSSPPIHALNHSLDLHLDETTAQDYLRFFCDFVLADKGPFTIVDGLDHPRFQDAGIDPAVLETLAGKLHPVQPLAAVDENGQPGAARFKACVWHGEAVFDSDFFVLPDGMVRMLDDEELLAIGSTGNVECKNINPLGLAPLAGVAGNDATAVVVEAEEVRRRVARGEAVSLEGCVVTGVLDLEGMATERRFVASGCRFRGRVNLTSMDFGSTLELEHCVFENGLDLNYTKVGGRLRLQDVSLLGGGRLTDTLVSLSARHVQALSLALDRAAVLYCVDLNSARIESDIDLIDLVASGGLGMENVEAGGNIRFESRADPHQPWRLWGPVRLNHARARCFIMKGIAVSGPFAMNYAAIEQYVHVSPVDIGATAVANRVGYWRGEQRYGFSLYGTVVENNFVSIAGLEVGDDLALGFVRVGTLLRIGVDDAGSRSRIGGDLLLGGVQVGQNLVVQGVRIGGDIKGKGITAGELQVLARGVACSRVEVAGDGQPPQVEAASLWLLPVEVGGFIDLSQVNVSRDVLLIGIECRPHAGTDDEACPLSLRQSVIGGNLKFFLEAHEARRLFDGHPGEVPVCVLPQGINLRKSRVGGDVTLSRVQCADGVIDQQDMRVEHDVTFGAGDGAGQARARALYLQSVECGGDIDLTGLALMAGDDAGGASVVATQAQVAGCLSAYRDGHWADIPGRLDLEFSRLGRLEVSSNSFDGPCDPQELRRSGLILNKAHINVLVVWSDGRRFPCPVDLRFMEVNWWDFHFLDSRGEETECPVDEAGCYIGFLGMDPNVQRHTYRAVERALADQGHEDAADRIHMEMKRQLQDQLLRRIDGAAATCGQGPHAGVLEAARQEREALRKRVSAAWAPVRDRLVWYRRWLWGMFTGYGTTPWRLIVLVLAWLALSTHLFSLPANIAPSEEGLAATNTELNADSHPGDDWGLVDGFWVALRYHVPIINFDARDEWELVNDAPMHWTAGDAAGVRNGPSAEDYAFTVTVVHWFLLPFIVFTLSRKVLRNRGGQ